MERASFEIQEVFHIGVCVKDLGWTVSFFQRVLGAKILDISPRDSKNQSFVAGVDGIEVMIAYVNCHGQLIEFMEYKGKAELMHYHPRMVDAGHYHLCLKVTDVLEAVNACRAFDSKIRTLSPTPLVVDNGPNKGNAVIMVVLPDGMMIEFTGKG